MIEIRQLRHFLAVVESGGFRAAVKQVHLSPSALTRSIQMLEDHYGVPLLDRGKGGVRPTAYGEVLVQDARRIAAGFDGVEANLRQISELEAGSLRVGISPVICDLCRPSPIATLLREHPGVELELECGRAEELLELLDNGKIDIIAAYERPFALHGGLAVERLYEDDVRWYVRRGHALADRKEMDLTVLSEYPLVMQPLPGPYAEWFDDICLDVKTHLKTHPRLTCALHSVDYELMVSTLLETECIGLFPCRNASSGDRSGQLAQLDLPKPPPSVSFGVAWPKGTTPSPLMRAFADGLKAGITEA